MLPAFGKKTLYCLLSASALAAQVLSHWMFALDADTCHTMMGFWGIT
jgi:hypothetical protein